MKEQEMDQLRRQLRGTRMSRRGFLYIAGMSSAAAFLAACGGQAAAPSAAPSGSAAPTAGAAAPTAGAASTLENEMFLYNWSQYVNPENVEAFSKQFNVKI